MTIMLGNHEEIFVPRLSISCNTLFFKNDLDLELSRNGFGYIKLGLPHYHQTFEICFLFHFSFLSLLVK